MHPEANVPSFAGFPGLIATTRELVRLGHHRLEIAAWAREGLTERILHGLYREADGPVPPDQCLHIPLRYLDQRCGDRHPRALISGQGGLACLEVGPFALPLRPLVLVDRVCRARSPRFPFEVRHADLTRMEPLPWRGLRLAPHWRLVADAALDQSVPDDALVAAVDGLRYAAMATAYELAEEWRHAGPHHAGARRLTGIVDRGDLEQESPGERTAFRLLFEAFPPLPDCQVVCLGAFRVDFVFLDAGLIIEYHGKQAHSGQVDRDATRIHALERAGFRVIVVTASMLREPAGLARWIHQVRTDRLARVRSGEITLPALPAQPPRLIPLRTLPRSTPDHRAA